MTARIGAVLVDLTRCEHFREQVTTVQAAMAGARRGTLCRLTLGAKTANPPMGWLSHGIMRRGYQWELNGNAKTVTTWLEQYHAETAQAVA